MTCAYDERRLEGAMDCLGEAFDYAVSACGIEPDLFMSMFIVSGLASRFGVGEPCIVAGRSGTELALEAICACGLFEDAPSCRDGYAPSREYWAGWALAFAQWRLAVPFERIHRVITMREIVELYDPLHGADETRFAETIAERMYAGERGSSLQRQRRRAGLTQRELAERSGVNLRTLQQYEIRTKDINKAAASSLHALSRALGCTMEDLLELPEAG